MDIICATGREGTGGKGTLLSTLLRPVYDLLKKIVCLAMENYLEDSGKRIISEFHLGPWRQVRGLDEGRLGVCCSNLRESW